MGAQEDFYGTFWSGEWSLTCWAKIEGEHCVRLSISLDYQLLFREKSSHSFPQKKEGAKTITGRALGIEKIVIQFYTDHINLKALEILFFLEKPDESCLLPSSECYAIYVQEPVYMTVYAPKSTYKFSKLISIHFLKECVERIW